MLMAAAVCLLAGCASRIDQVRINQAQVIGTHNSYHLRPPDALLAPIAQQKPDLARGMDCSQRPLPEQLSRLGIRQIELDCFADPQGGRYADPRGPKFAALLGRGPVPNHDPEHRLRAPGFKVMHVQDVDYFSTVLTLVEGLRQVKTWSDRHPGHFPVFIYLEMKEEQYFPALTRPLPFGEREARSFGGGGTVGVPAAEDPDTGRRSGSRSHPARRVAQARLADAQGRAGQGRLWND